MMLSNYVIFYCEAFKKKTLLHMIFIQCKSKTQIFGGENIPEAKKKRKKITEDHQRWPEIAEDRRILSKIAKDRQRLPKIAKDH